MQNVHGLQEVDTVQPQFNARKLINLIKPIKRRIGAVLPKKWPIAFRINNSSFVAL